MVCNLVEKNKDYIFMKPIQMNLKLVAAASHLSEITIFKAAKKLCHLSPATLAVAILATSVSVGWPILMARCKASLYYLNYRVNQVALLFTTLPLLSNWRIKCINKLCIHLRNYINQLIILK